MQQGCKLGGEGGMHVRTEAARGRCGPKTGRGEGAEAEGEEEERGLQVIYMHV